MICPYCLTRNAIVATQCLNQQCKKIIPPLYIKHHGKDRSNDPIMVSVVGFSGHGKTVFLGSLFSFIDNHLPQVWRGFSRQGLNQEGIDALETNVKQLESGYLPVPTPRTFPTPSIHRFWKLPKFGDQTFVIYDPPGEAFSAGDNVERYAGFVKQSNCVLFLISLSDLKRSVAGEMHRLLEIYQLGLSRMDNLPRPQHLIVVFTKADLLSGEFQPSPALRAILINKDARPLANLNDYLNSLKEHSALLRDFTANTLRAQNFINLAERQFQSVEYTIISSTGSNPENGRLTTALLPSRVFDPLLWVLAKEKGWIARHHKILKRAAALALLMFLFLFAGYMVMSRRPVASSYNLNIKTVQNPGGQVMFRRTPGKKDSPDDVIAILDSGTKVETLNVFRFYYVDGAIWEKVRYKEQEGWIYQKFLSPEASPLVPPPTSFAKTFDGNIKPLGDNVKKNIGFEMVLEREGRSIKGTSSYKKSGTRFTLDGTIESDGSLTIDEFSQDHQPSGHFRGKMFSLIGPAPSQSKIEGAWSSADNSQSFSFRLVER
jgi:hypothetical protein